MTSPPALTMPHNIILEKKESMQSEKQISVDPISLRESEADMYTNTNAMMYPVTTGPKMEVISLPLHNLLAAKSSKFMSYSLPGSAASSPRFSKKKCKNHEKQRQVSPLGRQHSVALSNLERLRRSKSCGEGRASQPSLDFDLCSSSSTNTNKMDDYYGTQVVIVDKQQQQQQQEIGFHKKGGAVAGEKASVVESKAAAVESSSSSYEEKFKCGACIFLPGFGKGKAVRARKELMMLEPPHDEKDMTTPPHMDNHIVVSQRVSLEKFECGSWRSSAAIMNNEEDASGDTAASNLFFDLPVELIRCSSFNDTEAPVTTGFVFDSKDHHHRKGVLKNATTATTRTGTSIIINNNNTGNGQPPRKSQESCNSTSSRHVRFSTSSPTLCPTSPTSSCITPRLRKARDDFNAFLEAQSA